MATCSNRLDEAAQYLRRAVHIAAAANQVMVIATDFRLTTLNAAILSTQGGEAALGFAQVAQELRRFTENVIARMQALKDAALAPVATVASVLRRARLAQLMEAAAQRGTTSVSLHAARQRIEQSIDADLMSLNALAKRIGAELDRAVGVNKLGRGVGRVARIEAARCNEQGGELMRVAEEFDNQIGRISELLRSIEAQARTNVA